MKERKRSGAALTVAVMILITLGGKVLGLVRDHLLSVNYGSSMEANAFLTASRIPRVFFDAVFASAVTACFIPVMSEAQEKRGREASLRFAGNFMTVMGVLCAALTVLGMVFSAGLSHFFADGYDGATAALCASLTRLMMPTVFFTGIAFTFVGILQTYDEFNVPAAISLVSNGAVIVYYIFFNDRFGIWGLAVAFLIAWALQAAVQVPSLIKKGFRFYPSLSVKNGDMKKVARLLLPVMVSAWVLPINQTVNSKFGSRLFDGAGVAAIEYAFNIYTVIAGVFVLQVTNYIFPRLSRESAAGDPEALTVTLRTSLHTTLFVVIPMTAGLFVMARPVISFIYGGGLFDEFSISITSRALRFMSLGMIGYAVQNVLSRAYFAGQTGKVPFAASVVSIAVNIALCAVLTPVMDVAGIAIASAAAFTVNGLILALPLKRRGLGVFDRKFMTDMIKLVLCAALMALAAWGVYAALDGRTGKLLSLAVPVAAGVLVYGLLTVLTGADEARFVVDRLRSILAGRKKG